MKFLRGLLLGACCLVMTACNPFPKSDKHPEVPALGVLIQDKLLFEEIYDSSYGGALEILQDGRILLRGNDSLSPYQIKDIRGKTYFSEFHPEELLFYIDSLGNVYSGQKRYAYPDFKDVAPFPVITVKDSMRDKRSALYALPDSVQYAQLLAYEAQLQAKYGSKDILVDNGLLINNGDRNYQVDFWMASQELEEFDSPIISRYQSSGGHFGWAYPVYLNYTQLPNGLQFKHDDFRPCGYFTIEGNHYLLTDWGLHRLL